MHDETALRAALALLLPAGAARLRAFTVAGARGRMRLGALATDAGVYAEVSNFLAAQAGGQADYMAPWPGRPGLFRFTCDVDLFYSDIEQTMAMSKAAAEAAMSKAAAEAAMSKAAAEAALSKAAAEAALKRG